MDVVRSKVRPIVDAALGSSQNAGIIAESLVLPHTRIVRLPVNHEFLKTAVCRFYQRGAMDIIQQGGGSGGAVGIWNLFRSPLAPLWTMYNIVTTPASPLHNIYFNPADTGGGPWAIQSAYTLPSSNLLPAMPLVDAQTEILGFYVPQGSQITLDFTGFTSAITGVRLVFDVAVNTALRATQIPVSVTLTAGAGTATITAPAVGFHYLSDVIPYTTATGGIPSTSRVQWRVYSKESTQYALFPAFKLMEATNANLVYSNCRLNASSFLLTDTAAKLNVGGNLYAARYATKGTVGGTTAINPFITDQVTDACKSANVANSWSGEAAKGCYTWSLPDQSSLSFSNYTQPFTGGGLNYSGAYDLADFWYVNSILFESSSPPTPLATGNVAQSFQMKLDVAVEFVTSSQLLTLSSTNYSTAEYEAALRAIARVTPFTENPSHFARVAKLVFDAMRTLYPAIRPYAGLVARKMVKDFFPEE